MDLNIFEQKIIIEFIINFNSINIKNCCKKSNNKGSISHKNHN